MRWSFVAGLVLAGCIGREARGVQFYAGAERSRSEVARLIGPLAAVDGHKVSGYGSSLELLPGCHVVEVGGRVGQVDPRQGGWAATLPPLAYAFRMRAAFSYVIEVEHDPVLGLTSHGTGQVVAFEQDPEGRKTYVAPLPSGATAPCAMTSSVR